VQIIAEVEAPSGNLDQKGGNAQKKYLGFPAKRSGGKKKSVREGVRKKNKGGPQLGFKKKKKKNFQERKTTDGGRGIGPPNATEGMLKAGGGRTGEGAEGKGVRKERIGPPRRGAFAKSSFKRGKKGEQGGVCAKEPAGSPHEQAEGGVTKEGGD